MTYHAAVAPECLENGTKEYYECSVCHNLYSSEAGRAEDELAYAELTVQATGHVNLTKHEQVEPGCIENGTAEYYECECGLIFADEKAETQLSQAELVIQATGHINLTYHEEVPAQCLENGTKAYYECECGLMFADEDKEKELSIEEIIVRATGHTDPLIYHAAVEAGCLTNGMKAYYECPACGAIFTDGAGDSETSYAEVVIRATGHGTLVYHEAAAPKCLENGNIAYYECPDCGLMFADKDMEKELSYAEIVVRATGHQDIVHVDEVPATANSNGMKAHYYCEDCKTMFSDENGENEVVLDEVIIPATGEQTTD